MFLCVHLFLHFSWIMYAKIINEVWINDYSYFCVLPWILFAKVINEVWINDYSYFCVLPWILFAKVINKVWINDLKSSTLDLLLIYILCLHLTCSFFEHFCIKWISPDWRVSMTSPRIEVFCHEDFHSPLLARTSLLRWSWPVYLD